MQLFILKTLLLLVALGILVTVVAVSCVRYARERVMGEMTDLFQDADWECEDD